jgi:hypothetical protein
MSSSLRIGSNSKSLRFLATAVVAVAVGAGSLCHAQETVPPATVDLSLTQASGTDAQTQPANQTTSPSTIAPSPNDWYEVVSPYLWFPGIHGTVGAKGKLTSVHASATDLLSNFRFGLMGEVDFHYKRFIAPVDLMWVRLGDDSALPVNEFGATSANAKMGELLFTPKIGYEVIHLKMLEVDALTGFRYWHLSQDVQFSPASLGLNFSASQNWVDPLVGGRIVTPLSPKMEVIIAGDVGGWNVGSQLEYQIVGLLGYKIKPAWTLQAGYRYLDVNFRGGQGAVFDAVMSGVFFGVSINFQ